MNDRIDIEHLRNWVGKTETRVQTLASFPRDAMAAPGDEAGG